MKPIVNLPSSLALIVMLVSGGLAQTLSTTTVIKDCLGFVAFLRFSPDGQELARICQFGPVALFDTLSYNKARTFPIGMRMVAWSPDGQFIATAEGNDGVRVWDATIPGKKIAHSRFSSGYFSSLDADELYLLDRPLKVLQLPNPSGRGGKYPVVFWAEFSPDGKRLITTHADGHVKVWNTNSWTIENDLTLMTESMMPVAFALDSKTVVIVDVNGVLHEWSFEQKAEINTMRTPGNVTGIAFSPDGKTLITTHYVKPGGSVMIWNTARLVVEVVKVKDGVTSAAFSTDGKVLALGVGNRIGLIDFISRMQISSIDLPEMTSREIHPQSKKDPDANRKVPVVVISVTFSPDGRTLAAGLTDGTVRLVDMTQKK